MRQPDEPYRVLVVDDEPLICDYIRYFLDNDEAFGKVVAADSVSLALQKINNEEFDLVIIDYYMPGKKGVHFVEAVKKNLRFKNLKILLISGHFNTMSLGESIKHGIRHVLVKPFDRDRLLNKVRKILKIRPSEGDGNPPANDASGDEVPGLASEMPTGGPTNPDDEEELAEQVSINDDQLSNAS